MQDISRAKTCLLSQPKIPRTCKLNRTKPALQSSRLNQPLRTKRSRGDQKVSNQRMPVLHMLHCQNKALKGAKSKTKAQIFPDHILLIILIILMMKKKCWTCNFCSNCSAASAHPSKLCTSSYDKAYSTRPYVQMMRDYAFHSSRSAAAIPDSRGAVDGRDIDLWLPGCSCQSLINHVEWLLLNDPNDALWSRMTLHSQSASMGLDHRTWSSDSAWILRPAPMCPSCGEGWG